MKKTLMGAALAVLFCSPLACTSTTKPESKSAAKVEKKAPAPKVQPASQPTKAGEKTAAVALVKPGLAKVGDKSWCLVSGEEFTVAADSPKVTHEGKDYYFCCAGCDKRFEENPQQFLNKKAPGK